MHSDYGVFSHLWALGLIQPAALRPDLLGLRWEYESEGVCQRAQIGLLTFCTSSFLPSCSPITPSHSLLQPKKQYQTQKYLCWSPLRVVLLRLPTQKPETESQR